MAQFPRIHGDSNPVFESDTLDPTYTVTPATGTPVNVAGPHLEFFGINFANGVSPAGQMGPDGAIQTVIQTIQQLAIIYIYQVEDDTEYNMSIAVYPVVAFDTSTLASAIQSLGTVNGYDLSNTEVYNDGFRLWF